MGMRLLTDEPLKHLSAATDNIALQQLLLDRDESDSYRIRLEALGSSASLDEQLSRSQVLPSLPVGSRWLDAVGWESYVVYPSRDLRVRSGIAIVGLEYIVPHPTRGAYPLFGGAIVPLPEVPSVLEQIAQSLDPRDAARVTATYGVVRSDSRSPEEHLAKAAWLLRAAASAFAHHHPLLVRTALLTEDEVPKSRTLLSPKSVLLGTVPEICARFSPRAKYILWALHRLSHPHATRSHHD
jgi:hypothetical protein